MWTGQKTRRLSGKLRPIRSERTRRSSRRGVLMLVVLSMLVLFMLIGTAFLMSSSQEQKTATAAAKNNRVGNYGTKLLERALLQVVRDTENPYSVVRYHSLLRDLYGTNGIQGVIYTSPDKFNPDTAAGQVPRYAAGSSTALLGPTNGQFIDLYVRALGWDSAASPPASVDDPLTPTINESTAPQKLIQPDLRHVLKLDRDPLGQGQLFVMPLTKGYFNGQLLTITSGPAAGQTTRILDYDVVTNTADNTNYISSIASSGPKGSPTVFTRVFRFRVMAFQRTDGGPLQVTQPPSTRSPEIVDLAGATFMVNGRAFSGTGVGYNPLATAGTPRLSAAQTFAIGGSTYGVEIGLLPNSVPMQLNNVSSYVPISGIDPFLDGTAPDSSSKPKGAFVAINNPTASPSLWPYQSYVGPGDANESYDAADFQNMVIGLQTVTPRSRGRVMHSDSTTPLDASDPAVTNGSTYVNTDKFQRLDLEDLPIPSFHRPDLINFWYHRMLQSSWLGGVVSDANERALAILDPYPNGQIRPSLASNPQAAALILAIKRQSSMRPLHEDNPDFDGSNSLSVHTNMTGTIVNPTGTPVGTATNIAIPYWEAVGPWDVDNDNDGVPDSVWVDLGDPVQEAEDGTRYKPLYAFLIVDLDSRLNVNAHGSQDDLLPPQLAISFNLDASGNATVPVVGASARNLAGTLPINSNNLSKGIGYGPAETSLRPLFPYPLSPAPSSSPITLLNRIETSPLGTPVDSYATLLSGRLTLDGKVINGRYGSDLNLNTALQNRRAAAAAGTNYAFDLIPNTETLPSERVYTGEQATPSLAAQMKFFDYPWIAAHPNGPNPSWRWTSPLPLAQVPLQALGTPSSFGAPPDLKSRYSLGLDFWGQPVNEAATDINPNTSTLPLNQLLPFNLLANTPYEIDLSSSQRRDSWGASFSDDSTAFTSTIDRRYGGGQAGLNDDAAFSTSDLEKVLRGWDPDHGTLPSRLWDVVDSFDPQKLIQFDPNNAVKYANDLLDPVARSITAPLNNKPPSPELMTGAQQLAGINRRLVTTDSFDLPVISASMPNLAALELGPDGVPGQLRPAPALPDPTQLGAAGTDDFKAVMGKDPAQATVVDLLQYRVWTSAWQYEFRRQGLTPTSLAALTTGPTGTYAKFIAAVNARASLVMVASPNLVSDLLAPEVIAGKKMDLNRPFGDGQDNNGDGVVDDPLEAGEPFLDVNGNGKYDLGEPFLDLDHNGIYTPPGDVLWSQLGPTTANPPGNGTLAEPISFDYTNGHSEPLNPVVQNLLSTALNTKVLAGVRNLESEGRQLFARHLYCLMLLLTDDGYIMPIDERNPQIAKYLNTAVPNSMAARILAAEQAIVPVPADPPGETKRILLRKLTCRMIAQWAVNVVDARDADSIMTPFEYDENPWDGWGVWNDAWKGDVTTQTFATTKAEFATKISFIPLDGDPATDENVAMAIDWPNVIKNTAASGPSNINTKKLAAITDGANNPIVTYPLNQTRGLVWGAERPDLLMTETLAFHDRRTEDLASNSPTGHAEMKHYDDPGEQHYKDPDPDQSLRPRGSLFVEVFNPWSSLGQLPAEIYSRVVRSATTASGVAPATVSASQGVELGRLSLYGVDLNGNLSLQYDAKNATTPNVKRSPVWRIMTVEELPGYRNSDPIDALGHGDKVLAATAPAPTGGTPTASPTAGYFVPTNPDFDLNGDIAAFLPTQAKAADIPPAAKAAVKSTVNFFKVQYPYDEREYYFTTDKSPAATAAQLHQGYDLTPDYNYSPDSFRLRIPYRAVPIAYPAAVTKQPKPGQLQRFIPPDIERASLDVNPPPPSLTDSPIAPIKPGRYGVIGSAGSKYGITIGPTVPFITTVGRSNAGAGIWNTPDNQHVPPHTRRIELRPNNDPEVQQVVVADNGGDPADQFQTQIDGPKRYDPTTYELGRDNELIYDSASSTTSKIEDITIPDTNNKSRYYQPCVAIPVAGMNISEPPWGYAAREYQAAYEQEQKKASPSATPSILTFHTDPNNFNFEGRYHDGSDNKDSYDRPFDLNDDGKDTMAPELERTGSTPNYRTLHLQRLANPQLPWNPPPGLYFEPDPTTAATGANPNPMRDMYKPNLPINPYRTIDTASVNLTAFNGVSEAEANYPSHAPGYASFQKEVGQKRPWVPSEWSDYLSNFGINAPPGSVPKQIWYFRSTERGASARLNTAGLALNPITTPEQRLLWPQEPAMLSFKKDAQDIFDMQPGRQMTMRVAEIPTQVKTDQDIQTNQVDMVMEHSLGFGNKSWGLLYDKTPLGAKRAGAMPSSTDYTTGPYANQSATSVAPAPAAVGAPAPFVFTWDTIGTTPKTNVPTPVDPVKDVTTSTDPWFAWNNRPYVSAEELLQVPCASSSELLQVGHYSTIDPYAAAPPNGQTNNPYGQDGREGTAAAGTPAAPVAAVGYQAELPFGHLLNFFASTNARKDSTGNPLAAPQFNRILDFVYVPSRFVGTDTLLNAETFNDVPSYVSTTEPVGTDISGTSDPRYNFQPPFNKVSREREPGKVNLNTVTGRRVPPTSTAAAQIWSEVYDGIMHRVHDANPAAAQLGQPGPAWRDVVLSRRGYVQVDALGSLVDKPASGLPDTLQFGLNNGFPTMFANPFRSADAADLVPVQQMMQFGVDATLLRKHPYDRATDTHSIRLAWGPSPSNFGDARDAGFDGATPPPPPTPPASLSHPSFRLPNGSIPGGAIPNDNFGTNPANTSSVRDSLPLFSEARANSFSDTDRNPYMMYQPMSRLANLVTDHSNVYAVWITVGYFEVEKAPDWYDSDTATRVAVRGRFGGADGGDSDRTQPTLPANVGPLALYNRVYPDGYMLGKELGSDTGDIKRPRGFYIIDRTEPVGFRPGEDLNVEKMIRLRRRIQ